MRRSIVYLDYESTPILAWGWDFHNFIPFHIVQDVRIMSVAWSYEGEDEVYYMDITEFPGYRPGLRNVNDKPLIKAFLPVLESAEAIIAHNGSNFDFKLFKTRMIAHGFKTYRPVKELDTKMWARRFRFTNNRLDTIARQLGLKRKMETRKNLHYECIEEGNKDAWEENKEYNKMDVEVLKEVAHVLAPYQITGLVNSNVLNETVMHCKNPLCGSPNLKLNGPRAVLGGHKVEYKCKECGHYARGPLIRDTNVLIR